MVSIFVGNVITGEVHRADVVDDDEVISNTIEGFWKDLGCAHVVWQIYTMEQSMDVREFQFNNYLAGFMDAVA